MLELEHIGGQFSDNGNSRRENESFHGMLFSNIDFSTAHVPISFFRGDFRQVKIQNVKFQRNNFDRADFIDAYLADSSFTECNFGTDFLNTYFDAVVFNSDVQDTCTIAQCVFNNCTFQNEVFRNSTLRSCRFIACTFRDCTFEMNTADELVFDKCAFHGIDFSNMTALNFAFANCVFYGFRIDPDYLGTYLFKGSTPDSIAFTYRGEDMRLGGDYLESLQGMMGAYANANRIFEAFNSAILYNAFGRKTKSLKPVFSWAINAIAIEPLLRRKSSLLRLTQALAFYADANTISIDDQLYAATALGELDHASFPLVDRLELESRVAFLRELIKETLIAKDASQLVGEGNLLFEVVTDEGRQKIVEEGLVKFFESLSESIGDGQFHILSVRKGSLIFECTATMVAVALFARCLRQASSNLIRIALELRLSSKYIELLGKARTMEQVAKVHSYAKTLITPPAEKANDIATQLADVVKEVRILGNSTGDEGKKQ